VAELEERFASAGYGDFKKALAEVVVERLRPIRERYEELVGDPAEMEAILRRGAERAAAEAELTMKVVRERTGLLPA
jgi:tryptophanyl-tRNA synthetase